MDDDYKFLTHYAQYYNPLTDELEWYRFQKGGMKSLYRYKASKIIIQNKDGTFKYIKNRDGIELAEVSEREMLWIMLQAKDFIIKF